MLLSRATQGTRHPLLLHSNFVVTFSVHLSAIISYVVYRSNRGITAVASPRVVLLVGSVVSHGVVRLGIVQTVALSSLLSCNVKFCGERVFKLNFWSFVILIIKWTAIFYEKGQHKCVF